MWINVMYNMICDVFDFIASCHVMYIYQDSDSVYGYMAMAICIVYILCIINHRWFVWAFHSVHISVYSVYIVSILYVGTLKEYWWKLPFLVSLKWTSKMDLKKSDALFANFYLCGWVGVYECFFQRSCCFVGRVKTSVIDR